MIFGCTAIEKFSLFPVAALYPVVMIAIVGLPVIVFCKEIES